MTSIFAELKRRNVYKVAVAYAVVGWLLVQVATQVFPFFDVPNWAVRLVVLLIVIGFPIALVIAWAFELTPQGIKRTRSDEVASSRASNRSIWIAVVTVAAALSLALYFVTHRERRAEAAPARDKSIAVLPFENLSDDKSNAYFADGIQDDVLTSLSKIGDLKVISRTSVMNYRGTKGNVREIAKALGVGAILEGSVRRVKDRVRVNVQLINGATDEHIWAEDYDRDVTDTFAIQSELAQEIANVLHAKLSPNEKLVVSSKPTQSSDAYVLYQQAHALETETNNWLPEIMQQAEQLLERATQLDPNFALAFAELARVETFIYHGPDAAPARLATARAAAAEAIRLQPDLPEAHMALGNCAYYGDHDYARALQEYAVAQRGLPNDPRVFAAISAVERRQGRWDESIDNARKAIALDPKNINHLTDLADTFDALRDYAAAAECLDRSIALAPDQPLLKLHRAELDLELRDDSAPLEKLLASTPPESATHDFFFLARLRIALMHGRFDEAKKLVVERPGQEIRIDFGKPAPKEFMLGRIAFAAQDYDEAKQHFEAARAGIEANVANNADEWSGHAILGQALAGIGLRDQAIAEGKRAVELLPESLDRFDGPLPIFMLAKIYAMLADADSALPLLEHVLSGRAGISATDLREPAFNKIRNDPRFQKLASGKP
jgi:TolB-like protein/Tfp pilus assembly protein PilF